MPKNSQVQKTSNTKNRSSGKNTKPADQDSLSYRYQKGPYKSRSATQTLNKVREQLNTHGQQFSKLMHYKAVEITSDIAGDTLARPSGLLAGGIFSLIGGLGMLIVCRYYGYEYNYLIGLSLFACGFILGLVVELFYKLFKKIRGS